MSPQDSTPSPPPRMTTQPETVAETAPQSVPALNLTLENLAERLDDLKQSLSSLTLLVGETNTTTADPPKSIIERRSHKADWMTKCGWGDAQEAMSRANRGLLFYLCNCMVFADLLVGKGWNIILGLSLAILFAIFSWYLPMLDL